MSKKLVCPVCKWKSLESYGSQGYICSHCQTQMSEDNVIKYIGTTYNTHKDHKMLNDEVTTKMRTTHFNTTGMYATDDEILRWHNAL